MLLFLTVCLSGAAQDKTKLQERIDQWKNDMKEFQQRSEPERNAAAAVDTLLWQQAGTAIGKNSFVIEADAVTFRNGSRVYVN